MIIDIENRNTHAMMIDGTFQFGTINTRNVPDLRDNRRKVR